MCVHCVCWGLVCVAVVAVVVNNVVMCVFEEAGRWGDGVTSKGAVTNWTCGAVDAMPEVGHQAAPRLAS